jgi:hypothetical protein
VNSYRVRDVWPGSPLPSRASCGTHVGPRHSVLSRNETAPCGTCGQTVTGPVPHNQARLCCYTVPFGSGFSAEEEAGHLGIPVPSPQRELPTVTGSAQNRRTLTTMFADLLTGPAIPATSCRSGRSPAVPPRCPSRGVPPRPGPSPGSSVSGRSGSARNRPTASCRAG